MSYSAKQLALSYPNRSQEALVEMILLNKVISLKNFSKIIFNPKLTIQEKRDIIATVFATNFSPDLINFLSFLLEENSLKDFDKILSEFKKILKRSRIALSGTVTTSKMISQKEKEKLEQDLTLKIGMPVVLETVVKPTLLGGVILEVEGQTYDNSFQYKLSRLK